MTRKLTAHQSALGARAYSHNASRRAHQLSQPRRERAMAGPVGKHIDVPDRACSGCGFLSCSCENAIMPAPCAPALPKAPEPARGFKVGQRVRVIGEGCLYGGREGAVSAITKYATIVVHLDGPSEGTQHYFYTDDGSDLEPLPTPQQVESDPIAECTRLGIPPLPEVEP